MPSAGEASVDLPLHRVLKVVISAGIAGALLYTNPAGRWSAVLVGLMLVYLVAVLARGLPGYRGVLFLVVVAAAVFAGTADKLLGAGALSESLADKQQAALFALVTGSLLCVLAWLLAGKSLHDTLRATGGVEAEATVLSLVDKGQSVNDQPWLHLGLEVAGPGEPFRIETMLVVPRARVGNYQEGQVLRVLYDPDRPEKMVVLGDGAGHPGYGVS